MLPTEAKRAGVREVIPGVLYQRGQFLSWPHAQKHKVLNDLGITCVVNLWHKIDPDLSSPMQDVVYLNLHMNTDKVSRTAEATVFYVHHLMVAGHRVLVHCEAGVNRSSWLCARLVRLHYGIEADAAWSLVQAAIPSAKLRPGLKQNLFYGDEA